jgi:hypothetical protein
MKQFLIFTLLCLLSFFGYSQNGGQFPENNVIKVEYLGYFNGNHTARVCNKQNCEARIRTKADQDPAVDIIVPANGCVVVTIARPTSAAVLFRAKAETSCPSFTNPDMGWLETTFTNVVLNLVEGNNIIVIRGPNKLELSIVGDVLKSSYGTLNYIEHIRIYSISGIIKYDDITFVKRSHRTDLNNYLKTGLNIIEVVIVTDKSPERFIFKYIKY